MPEPMCVGMLKQQRRTLPEMHLALVVLRKTLESHLCAPRSKKGRWRILATSLVFLLTALSDKLGGAARVFAPFAVDSWIRNRNWKSIIDYSL